MRRDICISLILCIKESEWVKVAQSCPTLCDLMHCSLPGSPVHGILQARILEWIAFPFSRGSSQPRNRTQVSRMADSLWTEPPGKPKYTGVCVSRKHADEWRPQSACRDETLQPALTRLFPTLLRRHLLVGLLEHLSPTERNGFESTQLQWSLGLNFYKGIYRWDSSLTIKNPVLK